MRSYEQFCPAAHALDAVGERWSLLVVRELLSGPKRYTDLQEGLPGIGPNVLADRLRSLAAAGLVCKRRLAPPAASSVYELTELGEGLRPVLAALFQWGLQLLDTPARGEAVRAGYWLPALEAAAREHSPPPELDEAYQLRVGAEAIAIEVRRGRVEIREGEADGAAVTIGTDPATFVELGRGTISALNALEQGRLTVDGDAAAAERCAAVFSL
jgi:DNA-binding HxlR family transcriptional regulator/putative sterol carrier protein